MSELTKNKTVVTALIIVVLAFLSYKFFFKMDELPESLSSDEQIGADVLEISGDLSAVMLNQDLFNNSSYRLLSDFSAPIPTQPVGRVNPFDVIGR